MCIKLTWNVLLIKFEILVLEEFCLTLKFKLFGHTHIEKGKKERIKFFIIIEIIKLYRCVCAFLNDLYICIALKPT